MAEEKGILATSPQRTAAGLLVHFRFCMVSQRKIPQSQQSTKHLIEIASILNKSRERARACSDLRCRRAAS